MKKYKNLKALNPKPILATFNLQKLSKFELATTGGGAYTSGSGFLGQLVSVLLERGTPELILQGNLSNVGQEVKSMWQTSLIKWGYASRLNYNQLTYFALEGQRYINPTKHLSTIVVFKNGKPPCGYRLIGSNKRHNRGCQVKPFNFNEFASYLINKLPASVFKISEKQKELIAKQQNADFRSKVKGDVSLLYENLMEWVSYTTEEKDTIKQELCASIQKALNKSLETKGLYKLDFTGSLKWLKAYDKQEIKGILADDITTMNYLDTFASICDQKENSLLESTKAVSRSSDLDITSAYYIKALLDENDPQSFVSSLVQASQAITHQTKKEIRQSLYAMQRTMWDVGSSSRKRTYGYLSPDIEWYILGYSHLRPSIKHKFIHEIESYYNSHKNIPSIDSEAKALVTYMSNALGKSLYRWFKLTPDFVLQMLKEQKKKLAISDKELFNNPEFRQFVVNKKKEAIRSCIYTALKHDIEFIIHCINESTRKYTHLKWDKNPLVIEKAIYQAFISLLENLNWRGKHFSGRELLRLIPPKLRNTYWGSIVHFNKMKLPVSTGAKDFFAANLNQTLRRSTKNRPTSVNFQYFKKIG